MAAEPIRGRPLVASALVLLAFVAGCGEDGAGGHKTTSTQRAERAPTGADRRVPGATKAVPRKPNILVVMTDDMNYRDLAVMPQVRSLLARRGTSFTHFYSTFPLCCPARATLLTGQYAHNHGVLSNKPPEGGYQALRDRADTLGVWLQRAGYRTAWIGKYLNGYGRDGQYGIPPGWSDWRVPVELTELRMYDYRLNENGEIVEYGSDPGDYQTSVLARQADEYVERAANAKRPFFLMLSPLAPHDESDALDLPKRDPRPAPGDEGVLAGRLPHRPPSFNEGDVSDKPARIARLPLLTGEDIQALQPTRRGRFESLLAVDEAVGQLISTLRQTRQLTDTVVVFTSDNGLLLGEHRLATAKAAPYEEATRVPLIVRGPGLPTDAVRRRPVGNVDLAPTFLDLAGARATRRLDGSSLLGMAANPAATASSPVLIEATDWAGVRVGRLSYVRYANGERELYDLGRDPFQLRNLAESEPSAVERRMAGILRELRDCAGAQCR